MNIYLIIFAIAVSISFALLEIQIEGENGWADKLPTWRFKNPLHKLANWPYITGYHIFLSLFLILILQLPFFFKLVFNLENEILILVVLVVIMILEDFFWFVFNPKWGIKRFFAEEIPWHLKKVLFLPRNYWVGFAIFVILEFIRVRV